MQRAGPPAKPASTRVPPAVGAVLAFAVGVVLVGCRGKVEQCNVFVDEANAGQTAYVGLEGALANPDALTKRADTLDANAKKLDAIKLDDDTLVGLRDRYSNLTVEYAAGLRKLVGTASKGDDAAAVLAVEQELDAISDKQQALIREINAYCGGR